MMEAAPVRGPVYIIGARMAAVNREMAGMPVCLAARHGEKVRANLASMGHNCVE
jgi:hypothetical protein